MKIKRNVEVSMYLLDLFSCMANALCRCGLNHVQSYLVILGFAEN